MIEQWIIIDVANKYEISSLWNVRKVSNNKKISSHCNSVQIEKNNGARQIFSMSMLMARHFLPNPNNLKSTSYKIPYPGDYVKHYSLNNLQWGGRARADKLRLAYYDTKYGDLIKQGKK